MAQPNSLQHWNSVLEKVEREYHQTLRDFVRHFRRNENPPQALLALAEELQRKIDALRAQIQTQLRRSSGERPSVDGAFRG